MSTRPGTKGWAVLEQFAASHPDGTTRQAVANAVGCTVQRVGEVVRGNSDLVVVTEKGGYAITPEAWKLFAGGEEAAAKTVTATQTTVVPVRKAEPTQAAVTSRLAAALAEQDAKVAALSDEPTQAPAKTVADVLAEQVAALSDAAVYKMVMADPANASDVEFDRAVAYAKAKRRKRPQREAA